MPSAFLVIGFCAPYSKSQVRAKSKYDDNNNNNCWMNVLALCEEEESGRIVRVKVEWKKEEGEEEEKGSGKGEIYFGN